MTKQSISPRKKRATVTRDARKFTCLLSERQRELLQELKTFFNVSSYAEVFRRSLSIALFFADIKSKGQSLLVVEDDGKVVEKIRLI